MVKIHSVARARFNIQTPHLNADKPIVTTLIRYFTKISSCQVYTTSRRGIKQLGISVVLFFFYFPMKVARDHIHSSRGKSPSPGS